MEGNSSCIVFYGIRNGRICLRFYYDFVYFPRVANGGMKGYEWEGKKRLLGGQEVADVKMNVKSVR